MTAVRIHEYGGPEVLRVETVPIPEPGPNQVLVRVRAASVTWWDSAYRRGTQTAPLGRPPLPLPFQLGREAAGEVAGVGGGVTPFAPGDRVVTMTCPACGACEYCIRGLDNLCIDTVYPGHQRFGGYAQYVVANVTDVLRSPDGVPDDKLASTLWSYATVLHMINDRAALRPGESVLVTAASSGMGTAALQLARLAGASPIIALTGTPSKRRALLDNGADVALDYHDPDVVQQIVRLTGGRGPDVVLDNAGGPMLQLALEAVGFAGRIVCAAVMAGRTIDFNISSIMRKHVALLGTRAATRAEQRTVLALAGAGKIDPVISARFPLTEAAAAHELLDGGGHVGKIVLLP